MRAKVHDIYSNNKQQEIIEIKTRKKAFHNNLPKIKRKSAKSDYVDKVYTFDCFVLWKNLNDLYHIIKDRTDKEWSKMVIDKHRKKYYDILLNITMKIVYKMLRHPNFKSYSEADKQDMAQDCIMRMINTGLREENEYFGIPYFLRFNPDRSDNIFSYLTQQISNFFLQHLIKHYDHENIKQANLWLVVSDYNSEHCRKGIQFHLGFVNDNDSNYGSKN